MTLSELHDKASTEGKTIYVQSDLCFYYMDEDGNLEHTGWMFNRESVNLIEVSK